MKTEILTIQPRENANILDVGMAIATEKRQFTFAVKFDNIANHKLQIITYDSEFGETFKFNQHIVAEVMNLVRQIVKGDRLDFPIYVGDFGTAEEAIALQKPFNSKQPLLNKR